MVRSPILYLINVWILIKLLILKLKNLNSPFLNIKDNKKLYKNYFKMLEIIQNGYYLLILYVTRKYNSDTYFKILIFLLDTEFEKLTVFAIF